MIWAPYCGAGPAPAELWSRWNLDPLLLAALGLGFAALWLKGERSGRPLLVAALAVLLISFVSPLCALSSALFSARTVHHILLVAVAAPLLAFALPRLKTGLLGPATLVQAGVFWAWHAPGAYGAALSNDGLYWLMQLSLLASAVWFWAAVRAAAMPAQVAGLLVAMVAMGLLGALITFAGQPLYAPHLLTTQVWGLGPLEDQQTAGLIMWAPAAALYLLAALVVLYRRLGPNVEARPA
jgi:putative membrane protein